MSKLEELRQSIDQIDQELVRLFERRMAVTREVGEYKQANGIPVLDTAREREVLAKKVNLISNPDLQADVVQLYENIMAISRRQQRSLVLEGQENPYLTKILGDIARAGDPIEHPRVVYQGEPGAYSEMAAVDFFGEDIHAVGLEQFEDVFLALKEGSCRLRRGAHREQLHRCHPANLRPDDPARLLLWWARPPWPSSTA